MDKKYCTLVGFQGPKPAFAHVKKVNPKEVPCPCCDGDVDPDIGSSCLTCEETGIVIKGEFDPKLFEITNHISFDVACIFDGKISPMTWMRPIDLTSEIGKEYLKLEGK